MRVIITVIDSINHTTMPYNEFVLYRNANYSNEKQIILLTGKEISIPKDNIPDSLLIYRVGKNPFTIRRTIKRIVKEAKANGDTYLIHLHSIRGSFAVLCGIFFTSYRKHTIYTIHSTYSGFRLHNKFFCFLNSLFSNYTVCVSLCSYNSLPKSIKRLKENHVLVIQNGVNTDRIDCALSSYEQSDISSNKIKFIYVARLIPLKNHKFLIDVLKNTSDDVEFIFVGLEDKNQTIREYAKQCCVSDRIDFKGLVPREDVYQLLNKADVYISSSTLEGLPVSVLEAMYCGLPCILSNIPQHREIQSSGEGVVLLNFNTFDWAQSINKFVNLPKKELKEIGQKNREYVTERLSLSKMHFNYDSVYKLID